MNKNAVQTSLLNIPGHLDTPDRLNRFYPYSIVIDNDHNSAFNWCTTNVGQYTWRGLDDEYHSNLNSKWSLCSNSASKSFQTRYFFKDQSAYVEFALRFG